MKRPHRLSRLTILVFVALGGTMAAIADAPCVPVLGGGYPPCSLTPPCPPEAPTCTQVGKPPRCRCINPRAGLLDALIEWIFDLLSGSNDNGAQAASVLPGPGSVIRFVQASDLVLRVPSLDDSTAGGYLLSIPARTMEFSLILGEPSWKDPTSLEVRVTSFNATLDGFPVGEAGLWSGPNAVSLRFDRPSGGYYQPDTGRIIVDMYLYALNPAYPYPERPVTIHARFHGVLDPASGRLRAVPGEGPNADFQILPPPGEPTSLRQPR